MNRTATMTLIAAILVFGVVCLGDPAFEVGPPTFAESGGAAVNLWFWRFVVAASIAALLLAGLCVAARGWFRESTRATTLEDDRDKQVTRLALTQTERDNANAKIVRLEAEIAKLKKVPRLPQRGPGGQFVKSETAEATE